jgi:hypothetical protein
MSDVSLPDRPQLCPCGHAPLRCALATLAVVHDSIESDPRNSPECCLGIARRATADFAKAREQALLTFPLAHRITLSVRDDERGRDTAAHCIKNAAVALERFIDAAERRTRRATVLLRKKFGKDACPPCRDESDLRKATKQLRWCESMLNQSRRGSNG